MSRLSLYYRDALGLLTVMALAAGLVVARTLVFVHVGTGDPGVVSQSAAHTQNLRMVAHSAQR